MTLLKYILVRWPNFSNYMKMYLPLLNHAGQNHFIRMVIGFIVADGAKNLTGLNHATFDQRDISTVCRFVGETQWNEEEMEHIRYEDFNRKIRRYIKHERDHGRDVRLYLCIDDTNNPKRGAKTFAVSYQYSHLAKDVILCQCLVTAVLVVGDWCIPVEYKFYRRQKDCVKIGDKKAFLSKTQIVCQLISNWQAPCPEALVYVVVDSWYASKEVIKCCADRDFFFIGGLMSNRSMCVKGQTSYVKVSDYAAELSSNAYYSVTVGKQRWRLHGVKAHLQHGIRGKVVFSHPMAKMDAVFSRYFFCTADELNVAQIMNAYAKRWGVEVFHFQSKQLLGLSDNQCLGERSIRRLMVILMISYSYLHNEQIENAAKYSPRKGETLPTLGEVRQEHKLQFHQAIVEWVYNQASAGVCLPDLLSQIGA